MIDTVTEDVVTAPMNATPSRGFFSNKKLLYGIVVLLVLSALLLAHKDWVVAGVVDGKPIWRWDVERVMVGRFGKQTLEGMISEQLIAGEAKKAGVTVSKQEIETKQAEIAKSLGANVNIDDLLKYQGITRDDFDSQVRLQLTVQKILGKDITITDKDVEDYVASNKATLTATDPAKLKDEARQALLDQKVGEKVQPWFTALKDKAKILRFL